MTPAAEEQQAIIGEFELFDEGVRQL